MGSSSEKVLLDKFNQIIESNFHNSEFGIDEICHDLGVSRSQLYRHIKEQTQLSPSLYIRQRKLIKARQFLETSDMKTAEIAYVLSIDSPQNFSKYFVKEFGVTPSAYRKQHFDEKLAGHEPVEDQPLSIEKRTNPVFHRKYLYAALGVVMCLILAGYAWKLIKDRNAKASFLPEFSENSIAIMPFRNLGDSATAYFSEGIREQIHGSLSLIKKLKVVSTTSSGHFRNSSKTIGDIAGALKVNYLLQGSVLHADKKIRINVELVSVNDDRAVWGKSYDGNTKDIFAFLNNVSREVARELDQKLTAATREKLDRVPTKSPEAYNEYLKGCQLIISRKKDQLEESIVKLDHAIEFDPEFAAAYASRAHAYQLAGENDLMDKEKANKMAEQNSLTAIRLDAENGLAYANLANIYRIQYKWEQARTAYEIALKYSPNDALINYWFSLLLRSTGNMKEAIRYSSRAVALDPLHHIIFGGHVLNCMYGHEFALAKKCIDEGRILFIDSWVYYLSSGQYAAENGNYRLALKFYAKANQMNPGVKSTQFQTVFYQARYGQIDQVNTFLKNLPEIPENYVTRSIIYAGLGDKKQSLFYLQKGADAGIIPGDIKVFPFLSILHDDPQYKAILEKFGL